jgi:DNA-binding SARP family transcriptional activator
MQVGGVLFVPKNPQASPPAAALGLLGGWHLSLGDGPLVPPHSSQRLLSFLALRGRVTRSAAAGALWPDHDDRAAAARLRTALWRLEGARALVVDHRSGLSLVEGVSVDVDRMRECATRLVSGLEPSEVALLERELLPGWDDDWLIVDRERQRQLRLHALEALSVLRTRQARHAEAVDAALAAVGIEPLRESAQRSLVRAHLAERNVGEAIKRFSEFRELIVAELGIEPSPGFQTLLAEAVADDSGRLTAALPRQDHRVS